ncbi:MAG: hypothetical protein GX758_04730, partial [Tenericutes bacterium]|nr:hypothetical protein [Mycoplasmatota bacterium]
KRQVPAYYSEINNYTLVGLKSSNTEIEFFVYDENTKTYTLYKEVSLDQMKLTPLKITKDFSKEYLKSTTIIDEVEFESLKLKNSKYSIINAKDLSTGEDNYYIYDEKTNTVIIFTDEQTNEYKSKIAEYEKIIMLLLVETCIIFIVLVTVLLSKVRKNKKRRKHIKEEMQKQLKEEETKKEIEEEQEEKKKEKKSTNKKK